MKAIESLAVLNQQKSIKCSQCGNEKNKFYLVAPDLTTTNDQIKSDNLKIENYLTEQQKNLAHLFEAQNRFGEWYFCKQKIRYARLSKLSALIL